MSSSKSTNKCRFNSDRKCGLKSNGECRFETAFELLECIKGELDEKNRRKIGQKVSTLFANNSIGKTRLSKSFYDENHGKVLFYNAFTEDLFYWENNEDTDEYILKILNETRYIHTINDQELEVKITNNFKKFIGSEDIIPVFEISDNRISFGIHLGNENEQENIKISRGEESVFVWSIFFTILENAIEQLNESKENRTTDLYNDIEYVVIDDPVSSIDDARIIAIALELIELISKSKSQLKFLITTHHALFFNVLFNVKDKKWDKKYYILSKKNDVIHRKIQKNDSPFAYHLMVISEIEEAIKSNDLKKYHFNLFRTLLEKTSNFIGISKKWSDLLPDESHKNELIKILNEYSHNFLSDQEPKHLGENEQELFKEAFDIFIKKFKWGQ